MTCRHIIGALKPSAVCAVPSRCLTAVYICIGSRNLLLLHELDSTVLRVCRCHCRVRGQ